MFKKSSTVILGTKNTIVEQKYCKIMEMQIRTFFRTINRSKVRRVAILQKPSITTIRLQLEDKQHEVIFSPMQRYTELNAL